MLLTIKSLAYQLSVKESWIRYQVFTGKIPFIKVGRHIRFEKAEIEKWLVQNSQGSIGGNDGKSI